MSEYTTTEVFKNLNRSGKRVNLMVKANGGNVAVNKFIGGSWVAVAAPIAADGAFEVLTDDAPLQIVPTGGAVYSITE
jgi:hypothetical protein